MTTAIIEVSAPIGAGKTSLHRIIATALMQIEGVNAVSDIMPIKRTMGRNPMERFAVDYDVPKLAIYGSRWCTEQRYVWMGERQGRVGNGIFANGWTPPDEKLPEGIRDYRDSPDGKPIYVWMNEKGEHGGFAHTVADAVRQRDIRAANVKIGGLALKPLPRFALESHSYYRLIKLGSHVYTVTRNIGGGNSETLYAGLDRNTAQGLYHALVAAYSAGQDVATDKAYDLGVQAGFDRGTAAGKALAPAQVVVTNNSGHAVTYEPSQDNAYAAQARTLGVATKKPVAGQGAPLAEDSAHIIGGDHPINAVGSSIAWNWMPSGSPGWSNGDGWKHVTKHTQPHWPNPDVKVDVHYESTKRTRNKVLATDINWLDTTITHWRFTPHNQL